MANFQINRRQPIEITDEALVVETQEAEENVPSEKSATVEDNILPDEPVPINSEVVVSPNHCE